MIRFQQLLLAGVLLGCQPPPPSPPPAAPPPAAPLLARATQLVVVTTPGWDSITGTLQRYARDSERSAWRPEGSAVPIVVGRTGLAWGVGFDRLATVGPFGEPHKVEGDGRSPAGIYPLVTAFGFAPAMPEVRLPYVPLTPGVECVDDTASAHYNAIVERSAVARVDWSSSEKMRQVAGYRMGVVVGYNTSPAVKGRGSCIFVHIRAGPRTPTVGCTALDAADLAQLMAWLDPRARPLLVQLPAETYGRMRAAWGLPELIT